MVLHNKRGMRGFTLVELIVVMTVIATLSFLGGRLLGSVIQNSIFIPNKLNMDMLASDVIDLMVDGDQAARGLRFCRSLILSQPDRVRFINQDGEEITYRLDREQNRFTRSINDGQAEVFPYYMPLSGVTVEGKDDGVFAYLNGSGALASGPDDVREIRISVIAKTGTGYYDDWQGSADLSSAVAVQRF